MKARVTLLSSRPTGLTQRGSYTPRPRKLNTTLRLPNASSSFNSQTPQRSTIVSVSTTPNTLPFPQPIPRHFQFYLCHPEHQEGPFYTAVLFLHCSLCHSMLQLPRECLLRANPFPHPSVSLITQSLIIVYETLTIWPHSSVQA